MEVREERPGTREVDPRSASAWRLRLQRRCQSTGGATSPQKLVEFEAADAGLFGHGLAEQQQASLTLW